MIVNKPQFDLTKIKPGQVYWLKKKKYNGHYEINAPCIIFDTKPLEITVKYYDTMEGRSDGFLQQETIDINEVVNIKYILEEMSVKEDAN